MNLVIHAHTLSNKPLSEPIIGRFDHRGGNIGRMETNTLILPDPDRLISRVQAEVRFSKGTYLIRNVGSANPLLLNGQSVMPTQSITLVHGDEIVIGTYVMRVSLDADEQSADKTVFDGRGLIQSQAGTRHLSRDLPTAVSAVVAEDTSPATLFPELLETPVPTGPLEAPDVPALPEEKDAFAEFTLIPELAPDAVALLSTSPLLAAVSAMPAPVQADRGDSTARFGETDPANTEPDDATRPLPLAPMPPVRPAASSVPVLRPVVQAPVDEASAEVLWTAFCEGADIDMQVPQGLNPDLMRIIGQLVRHAVDGTLKLVASRTTAKQDLRAKITTLQRRNNNPLKFSSDARIAIDRLLQPPGRDFMAGPAALNEVMDDLLGHANGTAAGMHAALAGVLAQFEPSQLESRLSGGGVLDTLLPMHRRAKLWELYLDHYKRIQGDAEDNYHELFGKAFMRAYEEELARLDQARSAA